MTLGQLRQRINATSEDKDHLEVKVWLPGSTISVSWMGCIKLRSYQPIMLLLEGNVDEGSALSVDQ